MDSQEVHLYSVQCVTQATSNTTSQDSLIVRQLTSQWDSKAPNNQSSQSIRLSESQDSQKKLASQLASQLVN